MTTLLTGDLHLSDNPRDAYRLKIFKKLERIIKHREVRLLVILGDLTEEKDEHRARLVNLIVDGIAGISEMIPVIWLLGNHDYIDRAHPFFRVLERLAGVEVILVPTARPALCSAASVAWGPVLLLPHTRDWQRDWQGLHFKDGTTAFAHNTFAGAVSEAGHVLEGIPTSVFHGGRCFAGDVHVPQKVGPVEYVGAPYLVDFGDKFRPRMILLDDDGKSKSLVLNGPGKKLIELHSLADLKEDHFLSSGDLVKVRVNLNAKDYADWPTIRSKVLKWGEAQGVQVHMVQPRVDPASVNQRIRSASQSDDELLKEYCKHRGIDKATERTGMLLLEEAP